MNKKSILIDKKYHAYLKQLAEAFNLPLGSLSEHMILYFKKTGINPKEAFNENPSAVVKALDKRIISFIKAQERDILKPMRSEVYNYSQEHKNELERLTNALKQLLKKMHDESKKEQESLQIIAEHLDPRGKSGLSNTIKNIFS